VTPSDTVNSSAGTELSARHTAIATATQALPSELADFTRRQNPITRRNAFAVWREGAHDELECACRKLRREPDAVRLHDYLQHAHERRLGHQTRGAAAGLVGAGGGDARAHQARPAQ